MDLFPFKLSGARTVAGVVLFSLIAITINALIWFVLAFIIAYAATKGYGVAS